MKTLLYSCLAVLLCVRASAVEISIDAVAETSLFQSNPNNNLGASTLAAGTTGGGQKSRAMFRFDVDAFIPANAVIDSVTLTLELVREPQRVDGVGSTFDLFQLNVDWGEGDKAGNTGTTATAGEATWNHRLFGTALWTQPGAAAGSDYDSQSSAALFMDTLGTHTYASTPALVADVQSWVDNPASDFGWILISQNEAATGSARRFGSTEEISSGPAPRLNLSYTVPEPGTAISLLGGIGMLVGLRRRRVSGMSHVAG